MANLALNCERLVIAPEVQSFIGENDPLFRGSMLSQTASKWISGKIILAGVAVETRAIFFTYMYIYIYIYIYRSCFVKSGQPTVY